MKIIATVNAKALAAATVCRARLDFRYYLNGVYIVPDPDGGVRLVSTDGHRLLIITDRDGSCEEKNGFILDVDKSAETKMKQKGYLDVDILQDEDMVLTRVIPRIQNNAPKPYVCGAEIIDGIFPEYDGIIPNKLPKKSAQQVTFNGNYMAGFCTIAKILGVYFNSVSFVNAGTDSTAINVLFGRCDNGSIHARAALMPLRGGVMDWLSPKGE